MRIRSGRRSGFSFLLFFTNHRMFKEKPNSWRGFLRAFLSSSYFDIHNKWHVAVALFVDGAPPTSAALRWKCVKVNQSLTHTHTCHRLSKCVCLASWKTRPPVILSDLKDSSSLIYSPAMVGLSNLRLSDARRSFSFWCLMKLRLIAAINFALPGLFCQLWLTCSYQWQLKTYLRVWHVYILHKKHTHKDRIQTKFRSGPQPADFHAESAPS